MHNLLKQSVRKGAVSVFLSLLLCFAVGFSVIGVTAWRFSANQALFIDAEYVTIAIPREQEMDKWTLGGIPKEDGSIEWGDGTWYISPSRMEAAAVNAPGLLAVDRRCLLGAMVSGTTALSSGALDILQYNEAFDRYCYDFCVLAVRCTEVSDLGSPGKVTESVAQYGSGDYLAMFEIVDVVSRLSAYDLPPESDTLLIAQDIRTQDGKIPFETGKTYLVRGFYTDYPIFETVDAEHPQDSSRYVKKRYNPETAQETDLHGIRAFRTLDLIPANASFYTLPEDIQSAGSLVNIGEGLANFTLNQAVSSETAYMMYRFLPEKSLPLYAQYSGEWRDFLNTPEGKVWKDEIIPMAEANQRSAAVILTDNLESMYAFNTGEATILEGRGLTGTDYAGANVCLVSAAYAEWNGLSVGDTLHLDFYDSGYAMEQGETRGVMDVLTGNTTTRFPLTEETRLGIEKDYEIVGIYTGPAFSFGVHSFHGDTIFVPKASVPNARQYEDTGLELLNSYILKNGSSEEFEAYMEQQNMGGLFLYYDQYYGDTAEALQALLENALRLFAVSCLIFVTAAVVSLYLRFRVMLPVAKGMRLLGISGREIRREALVTMLLWTLGAVILGLVAGAALCNTVTHNVLSENIAFDASAAAVCVGVECGLLLLAESVLAWFLSCCPLMRSKK